MARPTKPGLDYFALDVNFRQNRKIQAISATHGAIGELAVIELYCRIYAAGMALQWELLQKLSFAKSLGITAEQADKLLADCILYGIFDEKAFTEHQLLTSREIVSRYIKATERRFMHTLIPFKDDLCHLMSTIIPKGKERKGKEKKGKEIISGKNKSKRHRHGPSPKTKFFLCTDEELQAKISERGQEWVTHWITRFCEWAQKPENTVGSQKLPDHFVTVQGWEQREIQRGNEWCANYPTGPGYYPSREVQAFQIKLAEGAN